MRERLFADTPLEIWPSPHLFVKTLATLLADPGFLVSFNHPVSDPDRLVAFFAEEHDIRDMERSFLLQDPSSSLLAVRPGMPLDEVNLFDDHFLLFRNDFQDSATLAFFLSFRDHHQVIFLNMQF